jgi:hypothetical protein
LFYLGRLPVNTIAETIACSDDQAGAFFNRPAGLRKMAGALDPAKAGERP